MHREEDIGNKQCIEIYRSNINFIQRIEKRVELLVANQVV